MINKTQAKILRALSTERVADYAAISKATGLLNPIAYLSDLITLRLVCTVTRLSISTANFYQITTDGATVLQVYDRVEAHKARFSA